MTVKEFKEIFERLEGIRPGDQRLIHLGCQLRDQLTLEQSKVEDGDEIISMRQIQG